MIKKQQHDVMRILLAIFLSSLVLLFVTACKPSPQKRPNVIFVFADQWRAHDLGFSGNKQVKTPALDKLSDESVVFTNAVSGCPVCSPYRASLLTGQYPLTHGIFYNDKTLNPESNSMAKIFASVGYKTAYIGKWHLNGHENGEETFDARIKFIPKERRQGFQFWQVLECTHDYNNSYYYEDTSERKMWEEYDAIAQTKSAIRYIKQNSAGEKPFLLVLSWGPPHAPYQTAPEKYKALFLPENIEVRQNVPEELRETAQNEIAGYYAHIAALDDCLKSLLEAIHEAGISENTLFVFTSDHGDMLRSHGMVKKQKPWDESIKVPFLLHYPGKLGKQQKIIEMPINTPDILPTMLGLSGIEIPATIEGKDYSKVITSENGVFNNTALIQCPVPFHQWNYQKGGREYRGVRSKRYTYVRDLNGPWLLYDNKTDPYQMNNLVGLDEYVFIQSDLENQLQMWLENTNDQFLSGEKYMKMWGYSWDGNDSLKVQ